MAAVIAIIEFIAENWKVLSLIFGFFAYLLGQIVAVRSGMRALLRADLIRLYNKYHDDLKYCPLYVKQALEEEYKSYSKLKGNGVGTQMYEAIMALPTEPPDLKEE